MAANVLLCIFGVVFMSEIGAYVKKKREAVGYSLNKLSSLCEISSSELLKIEKGERKNPNCKCLCSIAKALNISSLELLLKAGYIEKSDIPPEPQIKGIEKLSSSISVSPVIQRPIDSSTRRPIFICNGAISASCAKVSE